MTKRWIVRALVAVGVLAVPVAAWAAQSGLAAGWCPWPGCPCH
ncbi:MAG TPA: hypothetical protein VG389_23735 [Myxococcota bacterium]|nr:hypothetical protein [Myxococcota bacterium]